MKKKLLYCLCVGIIGLSLVGCASTTNRELDQNIEATDNKADDGVIELTSENYQKYLKVKKYCNTGGQQGLFKEVYPGQSNWMWGDGVYLMVEVEGASTNFNYNDVVLTVRATGNCTMYGFSEGTHGKFTNIGSEPIDITLELETDIAGSGKGHEAQYLPIYKDGTSWSQDELLDVDIEVVSVNGTVTPA